MDSTQKSLKGSRTEKNILAAYISESIAYTRYTFYAKKAEDEKYFPIQVLFLEVADNELHHSKVFFKLLEGGKVSVPTTTDSGTIGSTIENLKLSISEERDEGVAQYRVSAQVAREEGFDEIANHFDAIADIEQAHERRFKKFLKHLEDNTLWKRERPTKWHCLVCGHTYEGTEPPTKCPACDHPSEHFISLDD